ncbi:MAG: spike base protein, RCAP_Rcc01079 family [Sulfitobacter sp.]
MPIADSFSEYSPGLSSPVQGGFDITADDAVDLPQVTRAVMVTGAGDVTALFKNGDTLSLAGLVPGVIYPLRVMRVLATGTTATGLKGLV